MLLGKQLKFFYSFSKHERSAYFYTSLSLVGARLSVLHFEMLSHNSHRIDVIKQVVSIEEVVKGLA